MKTPQLGQHFLTRPEIAGWVVDAIAPDTEIPVLEIGPGHGVLTRELLERGYTVLAIEKDTSLVQELQNTFSDYITSGALTLIHEDIRTIDPAGSRYIPEQYVLIANIPYYITGHILRTFLETKNQPQAISLLIQKEVAQRILARDNKQSILSLSVQAFGTPKIYRQVKAGAFSPPPKVDSAILAVENISRDQFKTTEEMRHFFEVVKTAFSQKRKMLGSTLKQIVSSQSYASCDIKETARPEDVPFEKWLCLISR